MILILSIDMQLIRPYVKLLMVVLRHQIADQFMKWVGQEITFNSFRPDQKAEWILLQHLPDHHQLEMKSDVACLVSWGSCLLNVSHNMSKVI